MPGKGGNAGGATARPAESAAPAPAPSATPSQEGGQRAQGLPQGVSRSDLRLGRGFVSTTYEFEVDGKKIDLNITTIPGRSSPVAFRVNGSLDMGLLKGRAANIAALKIARIIEHDASTRPNGFKYSCTAWNTDGFGAGRALAYERAGFSRPVANQPGGEQYAVVKNGRIQPNKAALNKAETEAGYTFQQSDYDQMVRQRERERRAR